MRHIHSCCRYFLHSEHQCIRNGENNKTKRRNQNIRLIQLVFFFSQCGRFLSFERENLPNRQITVANCCHHICYQLEWSAALECFLICPNNIFSIYFLREKDKYFEFIKSALHGTYMSFEKMMSIANNETFWTL